MTVRRHATAAQIAAYEGRLRPDKLARYRERYQEILREGGDETTALLGASYRVGDRVELYSNGDLGVNNKHVKVKKTLSVPEQHQLKIARQTLRMPAAMAGVMGGPSRAEAVRVAEKLSGESRPFARLVIERGKSQSGERGWTVAEMLPEGGTYVPHFRFWGSTLHEARAAAHKMSGTEEGTFIEGSAASEYRPYSPDDSPFPRPAMPPGTRRG